jgi:FkbM family methyltransferase
MNKILLLACSVSLIAILNAQLFSPFYIPPTFIYQRTHDENGVAFMTMESDTVLPIVQKFLPEDSIIVEAGAFDGGDTKKMASLWPKGKIYSFEPVAANFEKLLNNSLAYNNIVCSPLALSDHNGTARIFLSAEKGSPDTPSASSSLLNPKEHLTYANHVMFNKVTTVPTITLDEWAKQNNVDHIDLLWLDMQGYELNVLKASPNILKTVKVIYTEVEFVEAYEGQYLYKDVKEFLESQGFVLVARDFTEPPLYWFGNAIFMRR